ncbi:hypothetical protein TNCV_3356361 [Trichonephila clavipes]|nr:hypothetical protein TNCV_3356361 [Trichonephila clavipes]
MRGAADHACSVFKVISMTTSVLTMFEDRPVPLRGTFLGSPPKGEPVPQSAKQRRIPSPIVIVEFIRGVLRVPKKCPAEGMGKHNSKLTREELEELEEMTNCKWKKRKNHF